MIHFIEHALGLCGEKHISLLGVMMEYHSINLTYLINYIKVMYGRF
jgi:hypothetical protein